MPFWKVAVESPLTRSFTRAPETGFLLSSVTVPVSVNADAAENAVASTIGNMEKIALFIVHSFLHTPVDYRLRLKTLQINLISNTKNLA